MTALAIRSAGAALLCLVLPCVVLLGGCDDFHIGGGGPDNRTGVADWIKVDAEPGETAQAFRDCQDIARAATQKDADIDQDIAATRGADLQRLTAAQGSTAQMADKTRRSSDSIIVSCMRQKGFAERR